MRFGILFIALLAVLGRNGGFVLSYPNSKECQQQHGPPSPSPNKRYDSIRNNKVGEEEVSTGVGKRETDNNPIIEGGGPRYSTFNPQGLIHYINNNNGNVHKLYPRLQFDPRSRYGDEPLARNLINQQATSKGLENIGQKKVLREKSKLIFSLKPKLFNEERKSPLEYEEFMLNSPLDFDPYGQSYSDQGLIIPYQNYEYKRSSNKFGFGNSECHFKICYVASDGTGKRRPMSVAQP